MRKSAVLLLVIDIVVVVLSNFIVRVTRYIDTSSGLWVIPGCLPTWLMPHSYAFIRIGRITGLFLLPTMSHESIPLYIHIANRYPSVCKRIQVASGGDPHGSIDCGGATPHLVYMFIFFGSCSAVITSFYLLATTCWPSQGRHRLPSIHSLQCPC